MLTPDGNRFTAELLLDRLKSAVIVVGDGSATVESPLDEGFPKLDDGAVVFQATFGPEDANFEWRGEGIKLGETIIEWEDRDAGRKALGATWTTQIEIEVG